MAFDNIDSLRIVAYGFLSSSFLSIHLPLFSFFKQCFSSHAILTKREKNGYERELKNSKNNAEKVEY